MSDPKKPESPDPDERDVDAQGDARPDRAESEAPAGDRRSLGDARPDRSESEAPAGDQRSPRARDDAEGDARPDRSESEAPAGDQRSLGARDPVEGVANRDRPKGADDSDAEDEELDDDDELLGALSALRTKRPSAPDITSGVEERIRKRSAGRFFGERTLADRMAVGILGLIILIAGVGLYFLLRSSETGSLKLEPDQGAPEIAPGAREVMPRPE